MSAAISISNYATQPSMEANVCFAANTCLGTVSGKLLSAAEAVITAVAIPVILAVGLLESLVRACMSEDSAVVWASLEAAGELALFHLCYIIPSIYISTIATVAESREITANFLNKAGEIDIKTRLVLHKYAS